MTSIFPTAIYHLVTPPSPTPSVSLTCALAVLHVRFQLPALIAGAFHTELVLFTALAALQVFGTEALDLAGLVICAELHSQRTRANHALAWSHGAVVAAVAVVQRTQICRTDIQEMSDMMDLGSTPQMWAQVLSSLTAELLVGAIWAVIGAVTKFLCRQADGGVVGAHMVREFTCQRLAIVLV